MFYMTVQVSHGQQRVEVAQVCGTTGVLLQTKKEKQNLHQCSNNDLEGSITTVRHHKTPGKTFSTAHDRASLDPLKTEAGNVLSEKHFQYLAGVKKVYRTKNTFSSILK